jgi:hypothetical protein
MWYERCENPHALHELYASGDGLDRVELFEVTLQREGSRLRVRLQLPRYPDRPPARWSPQANAVQVTVDFWLVRDLEIEGWGDGSIGILSLTGEAGELRLAFESDATRLRATCRVARIDHFSAYTEDPPEEAS